MTEATYTLTIPNVFPTPQEITGFAADEREYRLVLIQGAERLLRLATIVLLCWAPIGFGLLAWLVFAGNVGVVPGLIFGACVAVKGVREHVDWWRMIRSLEVGE